MEENKKPLGITLISLYLIIPSFLLFILLSGIFGGSMIAWILLFMVVILKSFFPTNMILLPLLIIAGILPHIRKPFSRITVQLIVGLTSINLIYTLIKTQTSLSQMGGLIPTGALFSLLSFVPIGVSIWIIIYLNKKQVKEYFLGYKK